MTTDRRGWPLAAVATLVAIASACAGGPSEQEAPSSQPAAAFVGAPLEEQRASFAPYRERTVGEVSLSDYVLARSLPLISGVDFHAGEARAGRRLNLGAATALTRDGYLLTATHNVRVTPIYALVPDPQQVVAPGGGLKILESGDPAHLERPVRVALNGAAYRAHRVRVVWAGTQALDVALCALDAPLAAWFPDWIGHGEIRAKLPLVSAGWPIADGALESGAPLASLQPGLSAGPLFEFGRVSPPGVVITVYGFVHGARLRVGYSGGPLVTLDGKLVGVNVSAREHPDGLRGVALAPHPRWLSAMIRRDQAAHGAVRPR